MFPPSYLFHFSPGSSCTCYRSFPFSFSSSYLPTPCYFFTVPHPTSQPFTYHPSYLNLPSTQHSLLVFVSIPPISQASVDLTQSITRSKTFLNYLITSPVG